MTNVLACSVPRCKGVATALVTFARPSGDVTWCRCPEHTPAPSPAVTVTPLRPVLASARIA